MPKWHWMAKRNWQTLDHGTWKILCYLSGDERSQKSRQSNRIICRRLERIVTIPDESSSSSLRTCRLALPQNLVAFCSTYSWPPCSSVWSSNIWRQVLSLLHRCGYTLVSMMLHHFLRAHSICQFHLANFPVIFFRLDAVNLVNMDTE